MNKRQARIEALRLAAMLLGSEPGSMSSTGYTDEEYEKVCSELNAIGESLNKRAAKMQRKEKAAL